MRPGRLFIFLPYKLHKVLVEESQRELYQRTIIHLDNIVLHNYFLSDFTARRGLLQQLGPGGGVRSQRLRRHDRYDFQPL